MGIQRSPKGGFFGGGDISGDADFITIHTVLAHEAGDFGDGDDAKANAIRLAQAIMELSVINYISISSEVIDLTVSANRDFYGLGTDYNQAATTIYTIKFVAPQHGFITDTKAKLRLQARGLPFETVGIPITGASTRDENTYEVESATASNLAIIIDTDL